MGATHSLEPISRGCLQDATNNTHDSENPSTPDGRKQGDTAEARSLPGLPTIAMAMAGGGGRAARASMAMADAMAQAATSSAFVPQ